MFEWGRQHLPGHNRLRLTHLGCGAEASVEIRCAEGHPVSPDELGMRLIKPR
ncbi:transcriptional regulator [Mycobacterium tuberculosis]|nr:transcriptional regulator [Mycobacterium tuberculosis]